VSFSEVIEGAILYVKSVESRGSPSQQRVGKVGLREREAVDVFLKFEPHAWRVNPNRSFTCNHPLSLGSRYFPIALDLGGNRKRLATKDQQIV